MVEDFSEPSKPLVRAFLSGAAKPEDVQQLAETLHAGVETGRAKWGDLLAGVAFAAWLGERVRADSLSVADVNLADLYLAAACVETRPGATRAFERAFGEVIRTAVERRGVVGSDADDVVQAVLCKLLVGTDGRPPRIGDYAGRSALGKWVRVAAARTAISFRRSRDRKREDALDDDIAAGLFGAAKGFEASAESQLRRAFQRALKRALESLEPRLRFVLLQHYVHRVTLQQLAELYGAHHSTISRWLKRSREDVIASTKRGLVAGGLKPDDYSGLVVSMETNLDVSLSRLMRDDGSGHGT